MVGLGDCGRTQGLHTPQAKGREHCIRNGTRCPLDQISGSASMLLGRAMHTKNTGAVGIWVQSLGREDPLEKEKEIATHSSILPWKIPWMEEPRSGLPFPSPMHEVKSESES